MITILDGGIFPIFLYVQAAALQETWKMMRVCGLEKEGAFQPRWEETYWDVSVRRVWHGAGSAHSAGQMRTGKTMDLVVFPTWQNESDDSEGKRKKGQHQARGQGERSYWRAGGPQNDNDIRRRRWH